ncbi:Stress response protein nst1 [Monascus purpureus]|nr:Stress response protein nst1 [Monascus purpureus]
MPARPGQQAMPSRNRSPLSPAKASTPTKAPPQPSKSTAKSTTSDDASTTAVAPLANGLSGNRQSAENMPVSVNRKKQKRRQKQAARLAAEEHVRNGYTSTNIAQGNGHIASGDVLEAEDTRSYDGRDFSAKGDEDDEQDHDTLDARYDLQEPTGNSERNGHPPSVAYSKSKKTKGKKGRSDPQALLDRTSISTASVSMPQPLSSRLASQVVRLPTRKLTKGRSIWNTTTQEERENIKTFWLELGEDERRQLVKVEKDAVLKKMKEQQKHSCSCTVCGRKRTAIEEELEVLYDAYYEELEQYANNNQGAPDKTSPVPPLLTRQSPRQSSQQLHNHGQIHPSRGRIRELPEGSDGLNGEYDEDDNGDGSFVSEDDLQDDATRAARADFFAFGNSLTVKDGILTVADDLLKNDGKHFIDMMEQLAERRMQREEDTQYGMAAAHQSLHGHNHGPLDDDEDYDDEEEEEEDEEEEEYDSQEEDDYEEDEMDAMTEEQRMEEGRRMFQIFAARMFEQRVLTAYREKVALQRQQKLIEELMEEQTRNEQRTAKKARDAQKKKDKKRLQKQAREEERARREAEKAAEEAALRAEQEKKLEEQRRKREEQRKKKESEKRAQEEERARKEAEKQRRLREERERHVEAERKQRELKEQEKRRREESKRKEKEEREAREKELREKKAKEERERKAREEQARLEKTEQEREKREAHPATQQAQRKRTSQSGPVPIPSSLQHPPHSPHFQVATPVVPKAATPVRPRQPSQHGSHTSSPRSQPASAAQSQLSISPRSVPLSQTSGTSSIASMKGPVQQPVLHHPQPSAPLSPLGDPGRAPPPGFPALSGLPSHPPGISGMAPRPPIGHELPMYPPHSGPMAGQFRGFPPPNGIPIPPGINGARPIPPGWGYPLEPGHGLPFHGQQPLTSTFGLPQTGISQAHSRQASNSFERSPLDTQPQPLPVSRPSPIKRPSSTAQQDQQRENGSTTGEDVDDLSAHLGSSALLDDNAVPYTSNLSQSLPGASAPGPLPGPTRASISIGTSPFFPDPLASKHGNFPVGPGVGGTWGTQIPFGPSAFPGAPTWGTVSGNGWSNNAFSAGSHHRAHASRPVTIRLLVIQACKQLNALGPGKDTGGFHDVNLVLRQVEQLRPANEQPITLDEMLDICDTEGNPQNGGGSFLIKDSEGHGKSVKFEPDNNSSVPGHRASIVPGEIGSPVPSSSVPVLGGIGNPSSSVLRQFSSPTSF